MTLVPIVLPNRLRGRILRTDLKTLTPWTSFPNDIHQAIVENEERVRIHPAVALHEPVEAVLEILGVRGRFALSGGGNAAIVGDPDFSWVTSATHESYRRRISHYM